MSDIFLSYSREDQATARRFAEAFQREGLSVWWDQTLRSGENYDQVTEDALRTAKAVVVLWSKKSVASRWVRAEATLADRNRTLVPAMIEPCERPIMFELTQTADLSRWDGDVADGAWRGFLADVRRFLSSGAGPPPPQVALWPRLAPQDDRPSLAILPFANRSGERADDVFADGMVEDLISALSMSGGLKIVAQSATAVYRRNVSDLRTIGRELGVTYLMEGNVRRVGENLRVTAQLVEAANGAILWTQRFDRALKELAALQEQLVSEVAAQLGVQVRRMDMERALMKPGDLTAWEAVVRATAAMSDYVAPNRGQRAIAEARKAVAIAPDYAMGHAVLARSLGHQFMSTGGLDADLAQETLSHAERALSLSPNDPDVLAQVSLPLGYIGQWSEALEYAERAVRLNPNQSFSHAALGMICIRFNRPDDAIRHLETVERLAPGSWVNFIGIGQIGLAHLQAGRLDHALRFLDLALRIRPAFVFALKDKAAVCELLDQHEEAQKSIRRLRSVDPTVTLDSIVRSNTASFIPPDLASNMNAAFGRAWEQTPMDSP